MQPFEGQMHSYRMPPIQRIRKADPILVGTIICILLIGLIMVHSSSAYFALNKFYDQLHFLKRQVLFAASGFVLMYALSRLNYHHYRKLIYWGLVVLLIMLISVFFMDSSKGAVRWIKLGEGLSLQPSEFVKLGLIIYLAHSLTLPGRCMDTFMSGFGNHLIIPLVFIGLIYLEQDLGTSLLIMMLTLAMLFIGGSRIIYILGTFAVAGPFLAMAIIMHPYRLERVKSFLLSLRDWSPSSFENMSYHIRESLIAIGSGGLEGWGPGNGTMKMFYLPETHTDFIMSSFSQEFGFIGSCGVFLLFTALVMMGYGIAMKCRDEFGRLLAFGITTLIGMQFIINIGGVLGMLPLKGITLPLISYGGSSLWATMAALGILINIERLSCDGRNQIGDCR